MTLDLDFFLKVCKKWDGDVVRGQFGAAYGNCGCPISIACLYLGSDIRPQSNGDVNFAKAERILGVSENWIQSFYLGFDGVDTDLFTFSYLSNKQPFEPVEEAFELGAEVFRILDKKRLVVQK